MKKCNSTNPVNTTLKILGGKWTPLILWYLNQKTFRFNELQRELTGITQKMLTQQLREMELNQIISRKIYAEVPPKVEYSITDYGKTLTPVLEAMAKWGELHTEKIKEQSQQA
jgi:DNA-binding HxlR family transcriptional regulator